jgi:hypothetical protein
MEEIAKWVIEGGSFGVAFILAYYLFKRFIKTEVIEPIQEVKVIAKEALKASQEAKDSARTSSFNVMNKVQEIQTNVSSTMTSVAKDFSDMAKYAGSAKLDSIMALEEIKKTKISGEEQMGKLASATMKVFKKQESVETEVKKLGDDLMMIRSKVDKK